MDPLTQPLALLLLPLALWVLTPPPRARSPLWAEVPLVAALCVAVTAAAAWGLWPWHAQGGPYTSSDFSNWCSSIAAWNAGGPHDQLLAAGWHGTRSVAAGWLPATLAPHLGAMNALAVGALAGSALTLGGLYVWGRALHSPLAGAMAVVGAAAVPGFVILTHSTNFYPVMVAMLVWSAALAAAAVRWPRLGVLALGAVGAGLAFLADARGLVWGLAATGLVAAAALRAPRRRWTARIGVVVGILAVCWGLGRWAYPPGSYPLEGDVDARRLYWDQGHRDAAYAPPWERDHAYVWGRSPPWQIPETLVFLWEQRSVPAPDHPPEVAGAPQPNPTLSPARLEPWWRLGLGATLLVGLLVGRDRWRLVALAGLAPFAASLLGARDTVEAHPRFAVTGTIAVPVLLGVAAASGAAWLDRRSPGLGTRGAQAAGLKHRGILRLGLGLGVAWLLVTGRVPSVLSPQHPSRVVFTAEDGWVREFFGGGAGRGSVIPGETDRCHALFADEAARGIDPRGDVY